MKKIILVVSILSFFLLSFGSIQAPSPSCTPATPCCCKTPDTGQRRCYSDGVCCAIGTSDEYWTIGSCYSFILSASSPGSYVIGQKTEVIVTINNNGAYADSYNIRYALFSDNPNLMSLETQGATSMTVGVDQIGAVFPKVIVYGSNANGVVMINATSVGDSTRWKTVNITVSEGSLPVSLPEFGDALIIGLILLSGFAYFAFNRGKLK